MAPPDLAPGAALSDPGLGEFLAEPSFWMPERLVPSGWVEHAPFAFWLVAAQAPHAALELGVHHGFSYLAICQAVQRLGLSTRCYGIDTWTGDDHAGHYGPDVLAALQAWHDPRYGAFSSLVPSTFDAALDHLEDGSIDLLHIDGRHGYDDVSHDFETWLPKLSPHAVVLLHDTNVRRDDFGVARFWSEARARYPAFEFPHGHGLGVLGVGRDPAPALRRLFAAAPALARAIQRAYARLGAAIATQATVATQAAAAERAQAEIRTLAAAAERQQAERRLAAERTTRLRAELLAAKSEAGRALIAATQRKAEAGALRTQNAAAEHRIATLGHDLETARFEAAAQRQDAITQHQDAAAQRAAADAVRAERDAARTEASAAERRLAALTADLQTQTRRADAWRKERDKLLATGEQAQRSTEALASQLEASRHEHQRLLAQAHDAARQLAEVRRQLDAAQRATVALQAERNQILASAAWHATAPLRLVAGPHLGPYAGAKGRVRLRRDAALLGATPLFDAAWYAAQYPDVATAGLDPRTHYLRHGARDGRNPSPAFDTAAYLAEYPDVAAAGLNPLVHYLRRGMAESRAIPLPQPAPIPEITVPDRPPDPIAPDPPTPAALLARRYPSLQPVPVFTTPGDGTRRLTMVTDSINAGSLYGGVGTALVLATLLARRRHARLRILTRTEPAEPAYVRPLFDALRIAPPGEVEFVYAPPGDPNRQVDTHANELFLTTSWWTTRAMAQSVGPSRLVYLLQEDERMFYPHGDERLRCTETLADPAIQTIVNSRLLHDHLLATGIANLADRAAWFEPAFPADLYRMADAPQDGRRNFFFYARPNHARNLYLRGVEAVAAALEDGLLDPAGWNLHFVGGGGPVALPRGIEANIVPPLSWTDYAALIRRMDAGLCLMDTPHPSYPPLDLAASGAVVVTNTHGHKASLAQYSENILCAEPDAAALAQAIGAATTLAADWPARRRNYEAGRINRSWSVALKPVLDRLADR